VRTMINNSAGDCSISLRFVTEFEHATRDVLERSRSNRESKIKRDTTTARIILNRQ